MEYQELKTYILTYTKRNKAKWGCKTILFTSNNLYRVIDEMKEWKKKDGSARALFQVIFTGTAGTSEPPKIVTEYRGEDY